MPLKAPLALQNKAFPCPAACASSGILTCFQPEAVEAGASGRQCRSERGRQLNRRLREADVQRCGAEREKFRAAANGSEDSQPNLRLLDRPAAKKPYSDGHLEPSFQACTVVQASFLAGNFSETTRGRLVGAHLPLALFLYLAFRLAAGHIVVLTGPLLGRATFGDKHSLGRRKKQLTSTILSERSKE